MSGEVDGESAGGLSRRQLLTRGAIAGGLVWAAPVIRTTAAYATTANGTERPCTNFFMVTIDKSGRVRPEPRDLNSRDVPPAIRQWFTDNPGVTVQFPSVTPLLTQTSDTAWAVLLPEVTGPNAAARQCRMIVGWDEKGHKYAEGYVDPNPPLAIEVGRRLIFPCPDPSSHHGGDDNGDGDHNGDDGGCKEGHDDGDHDADDVGCDASAVASAEGATGTGAADATLGAASASSTISSDGAGSSGTISSDGSASGTVSSDGKPSGGDGHGSSACINLVYLIYCCPQ